MRNFLLPLLSLAFSAVSAQMTSPASLYQLNFFLGPMMEGTLTATIPVSSLRLEEELIYFNTEPIYGSCLPIGSFPNFNYITLSAAANVTLPDYAFSMMNVNVYDQYEGKLDTSWTNGAPSYMAMNVINPYYQVLPKASWVVVTLPGQTPPTTCS